MKIIFFFTVYILSFGLFAQEFKSLSLKNGEISGLTFIKAGTEKTARPVIWVHGILETSERWKEFMKATPEMNHFAVNLPMHGIGENITRLSGPNNYKAFYEVIMPEIIEHVYKTTGQKPLLVGFSLGAKTIHDTLVNVPSMSEKVEGVVELMRPNQLGGNLPFSKTPLKLPKPLLGLMQKTPTMPNNTFMRKTSAKLMPSLPDGIYTHLDGTEAAHIENFLVDSLSTQIGNEVTTDLIDELNSQFKHTDHGKPTWYVWADNDFICPGGEHAFQQMVRIRVKEYLLKTEGFALLSDLDRERKIKNLINLVMERKFPKGFSPLYGTSLGSVGHLGAVIPGSKSAKILEQGIQEISRNPSSFTVPKAMKLQVSRGNGMSGCAIDGVFSILNSLLAFP